MEKKCVRQYSFFASDRHTCIVMEETGEEKAISHTTGNRRGKQEMDWADAERRLATKNGHPRINGLEADKGKTKTDASGLDDDRWITILGAVHKVRYAIFANFPPPLSHFVTHPGTPPKVRHTYRTPRLLEGLV